MAIAKCRLDIWNPIIGGTATNKWVTAQTPENRNAVISVYFLDKLGNSRTSEITISNRAKNFAAPVSGDTPPSTYTYYYKDSDGNNIGSGFTVPLRRGVLTDFFSDFQFIRLVDQYSNQVLFAGRITSIKEGYDAGKGQLITLKAADALYELVKHSLRGMPESIKFYKGSNGHTVSDMVKAFIAMYYQKEYLELKKVNDITKDSEVATDALTVDTVYHPPATENRYRTNIVTDDTGTPLRHRFVTTSTKVSSDRKIDISKMKKTGILGEILKTLQNNPQSNQSTNASFGWDYFVDPNISYGGHADFKGKNLDPATPPPPQMFNAFERGTRIQDDDDEINPAEFGLAVKYPAASSVITQGHKTTVPASGSPVPQYATKPMSVGFDFTRPKEALYSSVLLKYNNAQSDTKGTDQEDAESIGKEVELVFDIAYVTEISGQFKYQIVSGSGNTLESEGLGFTDEKAPGSLSRPGLYSAEWCSLYEANGTTLIDSRVCRIQYQSDTTLTGATNYGYVLLSHMKPEFLNLEAGTYVIKGRGAGTGTNASNATCKINLGATIASQGYPRRVWGIDKQKTLTEGVLTDVTAMRQKIASTLSRSSIEIVDGKFTISGPPMYHWDGEVRSTLNVTEGNVVIGQQISLQNVGVHANGDTPGTMVELWKYGFREGMVIAKMNAGYTALAQTSNGRDIYGYCFGIPLDAAYQVNLIKNDAGNASEVFAPGDKVRFFIPLRAGDTIRVENVLTDTAGNHLITELTYTEEPNQMTRLTTTGVNEGFGLGISGFQASLAEMREESDLTMNLPKGHQIAIWNGLFSAVDTNTVQWQTVGGKAQVILADGTTYDIDTATTNNTNTTDASSIDASSNRFGLATPPAVGDDTIYYIYLDPNTENVQRDTDGTHYKDHFYTRPAGTPETGSDPVYAQDGDNIIVGWMKAGASGELAEFGVFRDSKPGEGKRNLPTFTHAGSATSALLKKGAQTFSTDLQIVKSEWDNDAAFREVKWHGGEKSDGTQNAVNATIRMADGTSRTILYGGDYQDDGDNVAGATPPEGVYKYTTDGTNFSTQTQLDVNDTYYAYIDFGIDASGNMTLIWTKNVAVPYGDSAVLLAIVVVPPTVASGRSPIIIPLTTKSLSINAVAIAANSITGDHVQANTIATGHITGVIEGEKVTISADTTFASPTYNPSSKTQTFVTGSTASPPTSVSAGDLWINPTNNDIYIAAAVGTSTIGAGAWVLENDAKTSATAAQATANSAAGTATTANNAAVAAQLAADGKTTLFRGSTTPTSNEVNDIWIHDNDDTVRISTVADSNNIAHWVLRDDANAINNALTSINGGLIKTQRIHLLKGGSAADAIKTTVTAVDDTLRDLNGSISDSTTTVVIDASTTSNTSRDLTGSMTNASTDTTLDVDSQTGSELSILVEDIIKVDTEEMLVTAIVTGTTRYTVTRGWRGTTIASHSSGADVHKYTSKFLMASDVIRVDSEDMYINSANAAGTSFEVTRAWNGTTAVAHGNNASVLKYNYTIVGMSDPHIIMDYGGIVGYSDAFTPEFSFSSETGKAMFGGGVGFIDENGIHLRQQSAVASRLRFETSSGGELSSIYTNQGTGNTDYTHWFTKYDGNPSTNGKEIHIGSGPDNINSPATPQTKAIVLNAQYIGIHPAGRSISSGPIYYRFPDDTPSAGDFLKYSGTTYSPSITGSTVTAYDLEWAASSGGSSLTIQEEGSSLSTAATTLNFVGSAVTASGTGTTKTITITGGGSGTVTSGDAGFVAYYPNAATTVASRSTGGIEYLSGTNMRMHGNVEMQSYALKFKETVSGSDTVSIVGPDWMGASYTLKLPQDDGADGEVLKTNGSGVLDWVAQSGGVTSVSAGNGMVFTTITGSGPVHLGDPSSCSTGTSNATTSTSHTHQITGVMVSGDTSHATHLSNSIGLTTSSGLADRFIVQSDATQTFYRIAASDIDLSTMNNDVGWVDGSGTTNRMAYWTDSNTLAANSTASTLVDIWVNDVRGIGSSPYCGITNNLFSKFMGVSLNLSGTDVKMTGLGTDSNNDATFLKIESNGTLVKSTSSRRYKENIVDLTIDTSKIFDLVPRSFKFKDQTIEVVNDETKETSYEIKVGKESFGLIAEEVNEYIPELVSLNSNGEPEAVDYVSISTLLITELKKLKARIEVLEEN